jgi:hypothetical protein
VEWLLAHSCVSYDVHDDRGLVSCMDTFTVSPLIAIQTHCFVQDSLQSSVEGPCDEFEQAAEQTNSSPTNNSPTARIFPHLIFRATL